MIWPDFYSALIVVHILVNFPIDDLLKNKYHLHNPKFKWLFVVSNSMEYSTSVISLLYITGSGMSRFLPDSVYFP